MNKQQIFICQLAYGGYPVDKDEQKNVLDTKLYKEMEFRFEKGEFKELWDYENRRNIQN